MSTPTLLGLCGSLRAGSFNRKLMHVAATAHGGPFSEGDLRLPLYDGDLEQAEGVPAAVTDLAERIAGADGVLICSPEYNKAPPGALKNALDWISRTDIAPFRDKPVALMSATAGRTGGETAHYQLRLWLVAFAPRLMTTPPVLVAGAQREFKDDGSLPNDLYQKAIADAMAALKAAAG